MNEARHLQYEINKHFGLKPWHESATLTEVAELLADAAGLELREHRNWYSLA